MTVEAFNDPWAHAWGSKYIWNVFPLFPTSFTSTVSHPKIGILFPFLGEEEGICIYISATAMFWFVKSVCVSLKMERQRNTEALPRCWKLCEDTIVIRRVMMLHSFDAPLFFIECVSIWFFIGVWCFLLNEVLLLWPKFKYFDLDLWLWSLHVQRIAGSFLNADVPLPWCCGGTLVP